MAEFQEHVQEEDRDRQAEVMLRLMDRAKNISAFVGGDMREMFRDEESIRGLITGLNESEFIELLNGVNGLLRGKEKKDWAMDGGTVMLAGVGDADYPPREKDKSELFHELFVVAQEMNSEGRGLEDIAILVAGGINAIHAYADANGRTSRLLYTLLSKGYGEGGREFVKNVLGEKGRKVVDVSPSYAYRHLDGLIERELGIRDRDGKIRNIAGVFKKGPTSEFIFAKGVSAEQKRFFTSRLGGADQANDLPGLCYAIHEYWRELPDRDVYVERYPNRAVIRIDWLLEEMTPAVLDTIIEKYWAIKKHRVELLIDAVQHPDKIEYQVEIGGEPVPLLYAMKAMALGETEEEKTRLDAEVAN